LVCDNLKNCAAAILEFNHQPELLGQGPYPHWLKARIASLRGHLSNQDALDLVEQIYSTNLQTVLAAHVSQINNSPALVRQMWHEYIARFPHQPDFHVARQDIATPIIHLSKTLS
jgi:phosphoribosyl 1,2-cyclic phosphodiesterase